MYHAVCVFFVIQDTERVRFVLVGLEANPVALVQQVRALEAAFNPLLVVNLRAKLRPIHLVHAEHRQGGICAAEAAASVAVAHVRYIYS